ncbi:hypothetical protein FND36_05495 [Lachnospiraceae bacterium KGMB03038]|nr:hypothetical protein FND36_05495 [Lachnospiraceae bacterium KGMB03038]
MRIGIIGPDSSCQIIEKYIRQLDAGVEVKCYPKEQVNACASVTETCMEECDAILFSGCAVESFVTEEIEIKKPYTSVEKSIISVAGAFLEMQKKGMELDAFSIDVVENRMIEDLLDAFHILARNIYSSSFQPGVDEEEYIKWHKDLQDEGRTNVALTAFAWVYSKLKEEGYNVIYLGPTRLMVRYALEKLQNEYALSRAEYSRISVAILQLTNLEQQEENYYRNMLEKTEVEKKIIQYVKSVQGAVFEFGRKEYVIFASAGLLGEKKHQNKLLKLQQDVKANGIQMNAGIGMGNTAYRAEMNARDALAYSLKRNCQEIYCINDEHMIEGPFGLDQQLQYELISSDPKIQEIAARTGLSARSVLKIIAIADARQSYVFDAHELADCLEVTVRSARRIMNKIMDAGLGKVYAKEITPSGGRPKTLIEILF